MDPSPDKFPVREKASGMATKGGGDVDAFLKRTAAQEGSTITKLTREDLEDRYLRIYEDHLILKRHAHKQEERIKKMATKLIRLVNDKKKGAAGVPVSIKDVEAEEKIADLQDQLRDSEKTLAQLQEKNTILKQQAQAQAPKKTSSAIYEGVTSRIDTGVQPKQSSTSLTGEESFMLM
jgi:protein fantom